ncbi:MAG: rod shape-determining protein MreC [Bacillota bacterium]|nr:rod shape-determining protein MreC [Bacillota bacterium]
MLIIFLMHYSAANRSEVSALEKWLGDVYAPLQSGLTDIQAWTQSLGTGFADKNVLKQEMEKLQQKNHILFVENQQLKENKAEVERLRNLLAFKDENTAAFDMEAARVIARSASNWYQILTIDKGSTSGIEKGMAVVHPDGLVGRVERAGRYSSQVWLITDHELAVGAIIQETRETRGIVEGTGNDSIVRMINIPYYSQIEPGQQVVTSGLSYTYPKGILIGVVESIQKEENGLVQNAIVAPAVDFDKLEEVLVIKSFLPEGEVLIEGE